MAAAQTDGARTTPLNRPPWIVRFIDPLGRRFLRMGAPMGPNVLLTVRGRKSGEPRSAGVALTEIRGRRFIVGAYGEVHWVRNLRAAGEGTIRVRGRDEQVRAVELTGADALTFFRDVLAPWVRSSSMPRRWASRIFLGDVVGDPVAAAEHHPVFELLTRPSAEVDRAPPWAGRHRAVRTVIGQKIVDRAHLPPYSSATHSGAALRTRGT